MDLVVGVRDAGKNLNKTSDDTVTVFERDGLGRALTVTEGAVTRERLFDGHLLVASGDTQLVRDPFGGVLAELDQVVQGNGRWATMVTRQQDVLTDVLGSTVAVAVDGVIDADLRLFGDFGEVLTEPSWDTVTGFTGKVETAGLTEFVTRSFDTEARVWVSDDTYRGQATRASSMNRYAYVEGAPESFVDHLGFFRAAAALEAQRLAAAEAAGLAAVDAWVRAQPLCGGYYGCAQSKTFAQQYADSSYAAARNAWSQRAVNNYVTRSNYEFARMNWNDQTITNALSNYAAASEDYARANWNERSIASFERRVALQVLERTEYDAAYYSLEARKTAAQADPWRGPKLTAGIVTGLAEFVWDTATMPTRLGIQEPVKFIAAPSFHWDDVQQRSQQQRDTVGGAVSTWWQGTQSSWDVVLGNKQLSAHYDEYFPVVRQYTYGPTYDKWQYGDPFGAGRDIGYATGVVATVVLPIKAIPKMPKAPVAPAAPAATLEDLAVIAAQAGERSVLAPGGGLAWHESVGGHAIARHVEQPMATLIARYETRPNLPGSSTFVTRAQAEAFVAETIAANDASIAAWLGSNPTKTRAFDLVPQSAPTGFTVLPGTTEAIPTFGARVVLKPDGGSALGYRILTAHPQ